MGMFKQYAEQLVKAGKAYYCFCTEERLNEMHEAQQRGRRDCHPRMTGTAATCAPRRSPPSWPPVSPYVIRQKMSRERHGGL